MIRVAALVCAGLILISGHEAAFARQRPAFRGGIEVVRVDALVTSEGRSVLGLKAGDFEVRDNGVLQSIASIAVEKVPLRIVLALDTSASVKGDRLDAITAAARHVLASVRRDDSVTILAFSHIIRLIAEQGRTPDSSMNLKDLAAGGTTSLFDAAHAALALAHSTSARSLAVIFSDGLDNSGWLDERDVIATARTAEVVAYTIGVPQDRAGAGNQPLVALAEATGGRFLLARDDRQIAKTFVQVLEEFRQRYLLTYTPTGVDRPGPHRIAVSVHRRGATVRARGGYDGGT